jgi:hypothetical protein
MVWVFRLMMIVALTGCAAQVQQCDPAERDGGMGGTGSCIEQVAR